MRKAKEDRAEEKPSVSWFELFYDLIFVAVTAQTGKVFLSSPTWEMTAVIIAALFILFTVWLLVTLSHSLVPSNDPIRRALLLIQMILLALASLALGTGGLPNWLGFLAASGALLAVCAVLWRNSRQQPDLGSILMRVCNSSAIGAAVLAAGALLFTRVADSTATLAAAGILLLGASVSLVPVLGAGLGELLRRQALDLVHLEERFALFVIIILGESFVGLLLSVGRIGYIPSPGYFVLTFLLAYAIWAVYYNSLVPARMPSTPAGLRAWILGHALLVVSMVTMAVEFTDLTLSTQSGKGLEFVGNWTPLPLFGVTAALALLAYVAEGVPVSLFRVQLLAAALLGAAGLVDLLTSTSPADSYTLGGAIVLIGSSLACAILRIRWDRQSAKA